MKCNKAAAQLSGSCYAILRSKCAGFNVQIKERRNWVGVGDWLNQF